MQLRMSADLTKNSLDKKKMQIFRAATNGEGEEIRSLLQGLELPQATDLLHQCIARVNGFTGRYKCTPLSIAALFGDLEVVQMLVEDYGMNIDQANSELCLLTALCAAVKNNHLEVVCYLVGRGCDVNLTYCNGETALYLACLHENLEVAKYLQENGASLEISNMEGFTCLMRACCNADDEMVQWLLSFGIDVNMKNIDDSTALHFAALKNSAFTGELLLEDGAIMMKNKRGFTPVVLAAVHRSYSVMDCFAQSPRVSKEDKIQGLELLGAMTLDMDIAYSYLYRAMKERYSDLNHIVLKAASPLPYHSHLQESSSMEELESRKSDHDLLFVECWATMRRVLGISNSSAWRVYNDYMMQLEDDTQTKFVMYMLMQYAESGSDPTVQICVHHIAMFLKISRRAFSGDTTLSFTDLKIILALITKKLLENENDRKTIVEDAGWLGLRHVHCLQPFLSQSPDSEDGTPQMELAENLVRLLFLMCPNQSLLHEAVKTDLLLFDHDLLYIVALVRFLLRCGADPNRKDQNGRTPLHLVAEFSETEENQQRLIHLASIADVLLQKGALPAVRNREGETALDLVALSPVKDVIRKFLPPSLQSLAAMAVLEHNIPFQSELSDSQAAFVQLH